MESLRTVFEENGYSLAIHREDNKSFYSCLYLAKHDSEQTVKSKNARQMQTDIFELERKNAMFFHLFLPAYCECDGDHSPEDCLKRDLDKMVKEKKPPTPRECFAAADLLKRCIYIIRCNDTVGYNLQQLSGYIFAPMDKKGATLDPICLLMIEKQNSLVQFANIYCNGNFGMTSYLGIPVNERSTHTVSGYDLQMHFP